MKIEVQPSPNTETADAAKSVPPKVSKEAAKDTLDTWVFEGRAYKAPEYELPKPLEAAFKVSQVVTQQTPPYAYDRSKFKVSFEETELEDGNFEEAGVVGISGFGDVAGITSISHLEYRIELCNAQDGKFPVTKEEMLKAVHAAKLELEATTNKFGK